MDPPSLPPLAGAGTALTKFRVPRVRRRAVLREALVARLRDAILESPLTLVVAPAGYGKTTALAQVVAALDGVRLAWVSLDEDDDDPNRFFADLVRALEPIPLAYAEGRTALIAAAGAGGTPGRAAVGALVNALCSTGDRLVLVFDDLHRVRHREVYALLEALVERLPAHVSVVLAGREAPPLPVARWVVRGEAVEFGRSDLRLDAAETRALAERLGTVPDDDAVDRAVARTDGWAAGLAMLLRAPAAAPDDRRAADATLFDYLASEVLAALPPEIRRFATDVAVLAELTPQACAAVTPGGDAPTLLRELLDRDLFVTVLDGRRPVLRFHELFREFLLAQLATEPDRLRELHVRAARAERSYSQALQHWIAASDWRAALERLLAAADELLAEGGHAAVERWLDAFPEHAVDDEPVWHYLRGVCAWRRWDWYRSRAALTRAAGLWSADAPASLRARTLLYLMGSRSGLGDSGGALAIASELRALPLDVAERAALALQEAWVRMGRGECERVVDALREATALIVRDPAGAGPPTADRAHSVYVGLPGAIDAYRELLAAYAVARRDAAEPWHGTAAIVDGWVALWEGDRARAEAAVAWAHDLVRRFGSVPPLEDGLARLESVLCGATGRASRGLAIAQGLVARFDSPAAAPLRVVFESAYVHCLARVAWVAADAAAFRAIAPRAARAPRPEEWAFADVAARTIPAQLALMERRWQRAADLFAELVPRHAEVRCPMAHADPRLGLAHARLQLGREREALEAFEPVLADCLTDRAIGLLLLEPDWLVAPLVDLLPPARRADPALAPWLDRLRQWRADAAAPAAAPAPPAPGPLAALSPRELDVLARVAGGASNKEVARELDLSLHTVKRHIANILGKLDCTSRRQAAELHRAATGTGAAATH